LFAFSRAGFVLESCPFFFAIIFHCNKISDFTQTKSDVVNGLCIERFARYASPQERFTQEIA
jgi:hypothetical protein